MAGGMALAGGLSLVAILLIPGQPVLSETVRIMKYSCRPSQRRNNLMRSLMEMEVGSSRSLLSMVLVLKRDDGKSERYVCHLRR